MRLILGEPTWRSYVVRTFHPKQEGRGIYTRWWRWFFHTSLTHTRAPLPLCPGEARWCIPTVLFGEHADLPKELTLDRATGEEALVPASRRAAKRKWLLPSLVLVLNPDL